MESNQKENRRLRRLPFSTDEGLIGVVVRPESENEIVIANIIDLSKSGCRILIQKHRKKSYSIDESLILMSLKGTVNLKFSEPIALEIRRINNLPARKALELGCQVTYVSDTAQKMLSDFIDRETRWKASTLRDDNRESIADASPEPPEGSFFEVDRAENTSTAKTSAERRPQKTWGVANAILAILGITVALLVFAQLMRTEGALHHRLDTLEARLGRLQEEVPVTGDIESKIQTIGERVEVLALRLDGIEAKDAVFEQRLGEIAQLTAAPTAVNATVPDTAVAEGSEADRKKSGADQNIAFHKVQKGENLFRISIKYGTTVDKLCELNDIRPDRPLYLGQKLKVPADSGPPGD